MELIKRIIALHPIASKDEIRRHLQAVDLSAGKERRELVLRVTDGFRMITERIENDSLPELIGDRHLSFFKEDIAILKTFKTVEIEKGKDFLSFNNYQVKFSRIDFPDLEAVAPKYKDDISISFNAKYLYELSKALSCKDGDIVQISFSKSDPMQAIKIKVKGSHRASCLLMPCRV